MLFSKSTDDEKLPVGITWQHWEKCPSYIHISLLTPPFPSAPSLYIQTIVYTYLYDVLSVLGWVLEDGATVSQVFFIEFECVVIDLLETRVPKLCLLQVDHEVSVHWATLNETHAAKRGLGQPSLRNSCTLNSSGLGQGNKLQQTFKLTEYWSDAGGQPSFRMLLLLQIYWHSTPR